MSRLSSNRPLRRLRLLIAVLSIGGLVAGCGVNETAQVRTKVDQFAAAVNGHHYATICTNVLGARLLADIAAGGVSCQKAMQIALGSVKGAYLKIGTIKVTGKTASVLSVTQATGEKTQLVTLELSKTASGWRIDSLGNAAGA